MSFRLTDIVHARVAEQGDLPALTFGATTWTYAELDDRASRTAAALAAAGVGRDDRVAWIGKNRPEFFDVLFGALRLRAATAPVNNRLTDDEMVAVVADSLAPVVVLGPDLAALRDRIAELDAVRRVLVVEDDYEDWAASAGTIPEPPSDAADDDCVLQLYTSGTTGLPKGVLLTHTQFAPLLDPARHATFATDSVVLVAMPLFHIGGCGIALIAFSFGARAVLVGEIVPDQLLDTMEREGVTNTFLVPAVLQFLVDVPGAAGRDWSRLRSISYGASPITPAVLGRVLETFGVPLFQVYGATETTGSITHLEPEDHDPHGPRAHLMRSAGKPYPGVELKAVDPDHGTDLGPNAVGEILIRAAQVTPGYWRRPEETGQALDAEGWLHTGDAGYVDAEGYLFLTDRIKDMIVTGAENVYPVEVESVLAEHPDIADVAVIGVPDERWGETVKAVVVPRAGVTVDPEAIVAWSRDRLAGFKRPRSVDVVDVLPRNPSGKILKKELRAPYWKDVGRQVG